VLERGMNGCGAHPKGIHLADEATTAVGCRGSAFPIYGMDGGRTGGVHASKESMLDTKQVADVRDTNTTYRTVVELALSSLVRTRDTLSMSAAVARVRLATRSGWHGAQRVTPRTALAHLPICGRHCVCRSAVRSRGEASMGFSQAIRRG
jgi:hypothetical protein